MIKPMLLILPTDVRIIEIAVSFVALYLTVFYILLYLKHRGTIMSKPKRMPSPLPSVSIIIPAYNEAKELPRCIESVLALNYPKNKIEVIVVDDGSTDDTRKIAKTYEKYGVKVFSKKNEGTAAATKNHGIMRARGDIIATLDADSHVSRSIVRKMLPYFSEDGVMAVTSSIKAHSSRGKNMLTKIQNVEYIFTLFSRKILSFIEAIPVTPGPFSMFRREVFGKIGYFDPKNILEDQEFAMRMQKHNMKIRAAMDAVVYTNIPYTLGELIKQRVRWHRGGLHNSLKYLEMIGPHYGDLGIIVMPLTLIAVILIFAVFIMVALYYASASPFGATLGASAFFLNINWVTFIGLSIFILNFAWVLKGIHYFKEDRTSSIDVLLYVIAYSYLVTLYWLLAFAKEITRQKLSW